MKSAFGWTGRASGGVGGGECGGSADLVPCWWKGENERFNPADLCVKIWKKEHVRANIKWKRAYLTDWEVNSAGLLIDFLANKWTDWFYSGLQTTWGTADDGFVDFGVFLIAKNPNATFMNLRTTMRGHILRDISTIWYCRCVKLEWSWETN